MKKSFVFNLISITKAYRSLRIGICMISGPKVVEDKLVGSTNVGLFELKVYKINKDLKFDFHILGINLHL
jgi:hypothetical protein